AATDGSEDSQATWVVRSWVVPFENRPVAVNWRLWPAARDGLTGVTSIESSVALVMVRTVEPVTPASAADTVVVPVPMAVARPWLPAEFETVATAVSEEAQVAWAVRSCVVPSEKRPVAANWNAVPSALD